MKYSKILAAVAAVGFAGTMAFTAEADLVKYKVVDDTIPASLTGKAGDPVNGRKVAMNRKKGNCLACHINADMAEQPFHGEVGPDISGSGGTYTAAELRMRIVDPKVINEDTIMPAFYKLGTNNVMKKWRGKTMLSAQEVEDVVAYMMTLKGLDEKKLEVLSNEPMK